MKEHNTMNASKRVIRVISAIVFVIGVTAAINAQPSNSPATPEQEFLDSIRKGNGARVSEMLKQNPVLIKATTKNGTTPVLLAVYARHPEIAESLLATGIEPNIFEAAATGRLDRIRVLLDKNPELVKAYSPDGWTALHLNFGNLEGVKLLLDRGADINAVSKNKLSATPLQGAAAFQKIDLAKLLIERGANVNCRGEEGGSPLHEVAGNGQIEFAKLLLDHGADINAKDNNGKTPLTVALENKQTETAKFLRSQNATQ
jgi:ankyrin repeat protein